jgi:hypothetical protein
MHTAYSHPLPRIDHTVEHTFDLKTFISLRHMVAYAQRQPSVSHLDFIKLVTLNLPEVAARIEEDDFGILHLEIGALKAATKYSIDMGDYRTVRRHLLFIADIFERADTELREAICISYLEALFLDKTFPSYMEARSMLSRPMETALRRSELHWLITTVRAA